MFGEPLDRQSGPLIQAAGVIGGVIADWCRDWCRLGAPDWLLWSKPQILGLSRAPEILFFAPSIALESSQPSLK
jgi:hypothetical protein